ncbi:MAG: hypothetical protein RLZZ182_1648 [Pseudomonadota bacterium]|jgi:acyl-CoA synthetase (AMP-forming)/AMP-acid ligase II
MSTPLLSADAVVHLPATPLMPARPVRPAGHALHVATFLDHLALGEAGQCALSGLSMLTQLRHLMWRSQALGDGLRQHLGVRPGDRVLLALDDDLTVCLLLWALAREGVWCVVAPRAHDASTWQALGQVVQPRACVTTPAQLAHAQGLSTPGLVLWSDEALLEATFKRRLGAWYQQRSTPPAACAIDGVLGLHLAPDGDGGWWPMSISHRNVLASLGQCEAALGTRGALHAQSHWWQGLLGRGMLWPRPWGWPRQPVAWTARRAPWWAPARVGLPVACRVSAGAGSAWRALPSTDVRILGPACEGGGAGEICVKGPQVPAQVWQQPQANAALYTVEGHLRTGVMGRIDAQGLLHLSDANPHEMHAIADLSCDAFT